MTKPEVVLGDGNAYSIIGKCSKAARRAGWSKERWDAFTKKVKANDYDHLLRVVNEHFDVIA